MQEATRTKAGYVAILGEPNVGKSTLMNAILGTKLSIVSPKPQTTRKRILGIHTEGEAQMIFLDTPGILQPRYELHRSMMEYVRDSVETADVLLVMLDVADPKHSMDFLEKNAQIHLKEIGKPVVVALNKMDALKNKNEALPIYQSLLDSGVTTDVVPLSALINKNVDDLVQTLVKYLPEHEFYYDPELLSEMPERFFASELIREAIFTAYKKEIPYSTEVQIVEFKERTRGKWFISAEIIVERDSQKGIMIGNKGEKLKSVAMKARKAIEDHLGLPVFLEVFVKVREDWRDNKQFLQSLGY